LVVFLVHLLQILPYAVCEFTDLFRYMYFHVYFFFSSRRRHTRSKRDWSSDVCSSDLAPTCAIRWPARPEVRRRLCSPCCGSPGCCSRNSSSPVTSIA